MKPIAEERCLDLVEELRRRIAPERLLENGFEPNAPVVELWMELTSQLVGFPRHFSQHPGGFVLARDSIEGYLEIMRDEGWPVPTVRRERVAVEAA